MSRITELKRRWLTDFGDTCRKKIWEIALRAGSAEEFVTVIRQLPLSDQVSGFRDLRGIDGFGGNGLVLENFDLSYARIDRICMGQFDFCVFYRAKFLVSVSGSFRRCIFRSASLRDCMFSESKLCDSDLSDSNCRNTDFRESDLRNCNFTRASLSGAVLRGCDLRGACFRDVALKNVGIHRALIDKTTDFRGADLSDLWYKDHLDRNGDLFDPGTNWQLENYDETTVRPST